MHLKTNYLNYNTPQFQIALSFILNMNDTEKPKMN